MDNFGDNEEHTERVLVFTSLYLISLLAQVKSGNIDGTFKSQSKQYKQLFIFQVSFKDRNGTAQTVPVAFGWLPDKLFWSYYKFILMILLEFDRQRPAILELTGSQSIKLRSIKCDFETNIHKAFSMFALEGCFFHYTQVVHVSHGLPVCNLIKYRVSGARCRQKGWLFHT